MDLRGKLSNRLLPLQLVLALLCHGALALAMSRSPGLARFHAIVIGIVILAVSLMRSRPLLVAYLAAYVVGCEVLWRMTRADIYWELGKTLIAAAFLINVLRRKRFDVARLPLWYLLPLLAAVPLSFRMHPLSYVLRDLNFNLSGPVALFASIWFFRTLAITRVQLLGLSCSYVLPVFGVAVLATKGILLAPQIGYVAHDSLFATSGNFYPNQVSSVLGLGIGWLAFSAVVISLPPLIAVLAAALVGYLFFHCVLTFSRGGILLALLSWMVALPPLRPVAEIWSKVRRLNLGGALLFALALPVLHQLTDGVFFRRFTNPTLTGRDRIVREDLAVFWAHPLVGVGPGEAAYLRAVRPKHRGRRLNLAHTEFTRVLAEHGLIGVISCFALVACSVQNFRRARDPLGRAWVLFSTTWSVLFMSINGMRLAAVALVYGLSCVDLKDATTASSPPMLS